LKNPIREREGRSRAHGNRRACGEDSE